MGFPEFLVVLAISAMAIAVVFPAARIAWRLGFSPLLGVLAVIPIVNVLLLWFVAYAEWPVTRGRVGA